MTGQTISHYKILEKLGGGGMGVVYKAQDLKLDRFVALKFLPSHFNQTEEEKQRFIQEAKAASALDHPNVCTIYEIDKTEDGQMFIAMAYYDGETLKKKIASEPMPLDEALDVAAQVAQGLARAHEAGIIHRDIKPANLMITNRGEVKIVDFGLAKLAGRSGLTKSGATMGTASYMSPEQAHGEEVDHRADIWSVGVVLYEMLTGQLPFKGTHDLAVMYSIMNKEPEAVSVLREDVPIKLERTVSKALAKSLDERYQYTNEMLADLSMLKKELETMSKEGYMSENGPIPSIAVLPFVDMSPHKDQEYFCDGIAEELIDALTKLEGLRVASRTSAFQFKDRAYDIRKAGMQLNVGTVLEGSVRKAGNRLRITAQLINVENGFHLWSEKYDRELEDVFIIQDDIARTIAETLKIKLVGEQEAPLVKHYTENLEAYNLYLKGRYFWNKRFEGGLQQAMACFEQAIKQDSVYALAHMGLADCYNILGLYTYLPPKEAFPQAKALAQKALHIDNALAEAHTSLGFIQWEYYWDWMEAEEELKRAIALNSNYAIGRLWYSLFLMTMGRSEESITEIRAAQKLDPLSLIINACVGWIYFFARKYDEAKTHLLETLKIDPNFGTATGALGWVYEQKTMYDEAIIELEKAKNYLGLHFVGPMLGHCYAVSDNRDKAQQLIDELNKLAQEQYVSSCHVAAIHVGLDEKDNAFKLLEKAYEERDSWLVFLTADPRFDNLRSDSRFVELLKKIGLEK